MKVLYDHQAFRTGRFSGIPRYFSELILQYRNDPHINPIIPKFWTINQDYRNLNICSPNITWPIRDSIVSVSQRLFHQNPSRLLDGAERKTVQLLRNQDFDIFHPTRLEPYFLKYIGNKPYVLTIHDLTYEKYPEYFPLSTKVRSNTEVIIRKAAHFIADSYATKSDFVEYYDIDSDMINVVYLGSLFEKYSIPQKETCFTPSPSFPYLLYVGERSPHKNFYHFVLAIRSLLQSGECRLICAGGGLFRREEIRFLDSLGLLNSVHQETVTDQKLISLYQNAVAFVFPSVNEGFGLPILEAFSCGCPVVCSGTSSLPEIGGDAAVYFDPKDAGSMREAIYKLLNDDHLHQKMQMLGYQQLEMFSWRKCAKDNTCSHAARRPGGPGPSGARR